MWWSRVVFGIALMAIISSCSSTSKENVYPFSHAARVEVISYPSRAIWGNTEDTDFIDDGKLSFDVSKIKDRVELNEEQKEKLYQFLFEEDCPFYGAVAKCYEPRHLILFYNADGKLFNYFEVCLECGRAEGGFQYTDVCDDRMTDLKAIFKDAGIKYFGEEGE